MLEKYILGILAITFLGSIQFWGLFLWLKYWPFQTWALSLLWTSKQRTCGRVASRTNMRLLAAINDRSNFSLFWALKKKFLSSDSVLLISVLCLHPLALMLVMIVKCKLMLSLCELSLSSYYSRPLCTFFGNILCKYPHQTPLLYVNGTWRLEMLVLDFT